MTITWEYKAESEPEPGRVSGVESPYYVDGSAPDYWTLQARIRRAIDALLSMGLPCVR